MFQIDLGLILFESVSGTFRVNTFTGVLGSLMVDTFCQCFRVLFGHLVDKPA